jgi:phosphatidylserine/phosphatidylglycerophosphate/cardiolipin synthase-like enzyme
MIAGGRRRVNSLGSAGQSGAGTNWLAIAAPRHAATSTERCFPAVNRFLLRRLARLAAFAVVLLVAASALAMPADGATPVNNREYAQAVRKLIQGAKHSLRIMLYQARFYPEYPDTITNFFIDDLIAAKQRGVDVKILVDTGVWNPNSKNEHILDFVDRLTTAGVEFCQDAEQDVSHQ